VHCDELHPVVELPLVVVVVVVTGAGLGVITSFSQEMNNIEVSRVVMMSVFFISQRNNKYLNLQNYIKKKSLTLERDSNELH
jgi:uracil phosphoribosyltransferase